MKSCQEDFRRCCHSYKDVLYYIRFRYLRYLYAYLIPDISAIGVKNTIAE